MSNHKNLKFFNKEGDYLNFNYNEGYERFEGDILFHENSTDTFKTYAIYTLENIPSFDFESIGELTTKKFQLFNEFGLHFYGSKYYKQKVDRIEPVNNDPEFYTKWIYGGGFETKFPIGTLVKFDSIAFEFTNLDESYVVVGSKVGAIMILSKMDNDTFESSFFYQYIEPEYYVDLNISGVNAFGVYDYIDSQYSERLSNWNEPDFYDKYYPGKKLNVVGSKKNDGILTVKDLAINDATHWEYFVDKANLPDNSDLIVEVITRTDVPLVYSGGIDITSTFKLNIDLSYPQILKPNVEFKIVGSVNNTIFYTVSDMPVFNTLNSVTYFELGSQVLYNNRVYENLQSYTYSFQSSTAYITPENTSYWTSEPTYIKVNEQTSIENVLNGKIYLTTDRYYYSFGWTSSSEACLAATAEKYNADLNIFNVDLYYLNGSLRADLKYPSNYAKVNFYHTQVGATYSIGGLKQTYERLVEIEEQLDYELNYNYSQNKKVNVVFTDIDEFGIKITINKMVYDEEVALLYSGLNIDMERTIDRTLRNWLSRWHLKLHTLGIVVDLKYSGNFTSLFYNTIVLKTTYPNVPMEVNRIEVGTTADFYVEHSKILFTSMGPYLNIKINDKNFDQQSIFDINSNVDIPATLIAWYDTNSELLLTYGITSSVANNLLKLNLTSLEYRLDYTINTGKLNYPGVNDYKSTKYLLGNIGTLVASNEIVLPSTSDFSFEDVGFSTGMAFTVNNTVYPYVNQDYTIQFLDPHVLNISYQGPFWGLSQSPCDSSGFITLAFDMGFGQTACNGPISPTGSGGPFNMSMFNSNQFAITFNSNNYNLNTYQSSDNLIDIEYVQLTNCVYGFGDDVVVLDALHGYIISNIPLLGNTQSIEMEFNTFNNYIYCLSEKYMWVIDPTSNTLISKILFNPSAIAYDMEVNPNNGDVYVSYQNLTHVDIWAYNNMSSVSTDSISTSGYGYPGAMVFNDFEGDMYITCTNNAVIRVNGGPNINFVSNPNRTISTIYGIPGSTHSIFYEPVYEAIYVYGSSTLWKIDNGITQSVSISTSGFNDIIFNNLTGEMNISDSSLDFSRLSLSTNAVSQSNIANYGFLGINQYDGDIYLSSQNFNNIIVIKGVNGQVVHTEPMAAPTGRMVYNPERKSMWVIQPSTNSIIEIASELNLSITETSTSGLSVGEGLYGTLDSNYIPHESIWIKTREYFRRPRENFEGDIPVNLYWRWMTDEVPDFFLYDFTGEQLTSTGSYAYTGDKPLENVVLNTSPNKDLNKVSYPEYQQTVFDKINYELSYIDDVNDISVEAKSLELFIGYRSTVEGSVRNVLQLYKREDIEFEIVSDNSTYLKFETLTNNSDKRGQISINADSVENFTGRGLKEGQHITVYLTDDSNIKNQYVSSNNAIILKIRSVFTKILIVDFFNIDFDFIETEYTSISDYPSYSKNTYLKTRFKVRDREIGRFITYGQSEEEDIRFKYELGNIGKLIKPDEVFIFSEYDVNEGGIDWMILNRKRKEMLMNRNLIYPYVGSYLSIINAINYFGYNDLQLNEYYRNKEITNGVKGSNFGKLFKVEIPDIFDNTVKGWNDKDFLKNYLPNDNFEETNMFNLTYFITDKEGNYILNYSIDEIIIKLQGLKYWLKRNIIPLTHKIMDISGKAYFNGGTSIQHNVYDTRIINIREDMTPVTFKLNESYLYPVNSGSTVYNCVLDFYSIIENIGADKEDRMVNTSFGFKLVSPPKPYNDLKANMKMPDIYDVKIRTYKVYKEWAPFVTYSKGDKIYYYDKLYESTKDGNKINNPKKYENIESWNVSSVYSVATVVQYEREYYTYSGLGDPYSTLSPNFDPNNWLNITDWRFIDFEPVQYITEFRTGDDLRPFNFTIDSNIDPFLVIEITSHSGYGQVYMDKKNYQIKGLKDLTEPYTYIDTIGPFQPIIPIELQTN